MVYQVGGQNQFKTILVVPYQFATLLNSMFTYTCKYNAELKQMIYSQQAGRPQQYFELSL